MISVMVGAVTPMGWSGCSGGLMGMVKVVLARAVYLGAEMVRAKWPWLPSPPWEWMEVVLEFSSCCAFCRVMKVGSSVVVAVGDRLGTGKLAVRVAAVVVMVLVLKWAGCASWSWFGRFVRVAGPIGCLNCKRWNGGLGLVVFVTLLSRADRVLKL